MEKKIYVCFMLYLIYTTNAQDIEPPDLSEFPQPTTKITLMTTEGPNGPRFDKILNMVSESTTESAETTISETETTTEPPATVTTTTVPETTTTTTTTTTTSTPEQPINTPTTTQTTFTTTTSTPEPTINTTTTTQRTLTTTTSTPEPPINTTTTTQTTFTKTTSTPEPTINTTTTTTQTTFTTTTTSPWIPITTKKVQLPPCWNCYYKEMLGYPHLEFTSTGLKYVHSLNCYRCCYYIGSEFAGCTQINHLICEDYYARAKKLND